MRGRRVDPLVVIGGVLLVLTAVLAALGTRGDGQDHGRTASVYDEGPGGAATARRLLDALGVRTTTIEGDTFAPHIGSSRVVFMLGASELVSAQDVAALRTYLHEGGTVVVAHDLELFIAPLLEGFDLHLGRAAAASATRLAGPLFAAPPARRIESDIGRELRLGPAWDALGTDGQAPTVAMRTDGPGTIVFVGTVTPFLSASLADADNARFVVALTAAARAAGGAVAFDEYHHGVHPAPSLLALVERTWPGRALLFAFLVAFAYVVLTGRRLGPPQPLDPRPPRSSLEYVRGFAGLVRRAGRQEIVRDRLRHELHTGLARAAGLDPATPFAQVVERIRDGSAARADEAASIDLRLTQRLREPDLVRTVARVATLLREEGS
ncbi:MAG TPA: DUF4350 domain-containing protein [Candidatus Limnocylindria bacterium]|nr:DUF4350 domain-containing protein [Candidatus Limnocylindria bacterium]